MAGPLWPPGPALVLGTVAAVAWNWWLSLKRWWGAPPGRRVPDRTGPAAAVRSAGPAHMPQTGHPSTDAPPGVSNPPEIHRAAPVDEVESKPMVTRDLSTLSRAGTGEGV